MNEVGASKGAEGLEGEPENKFQDLLDLERELRTQLDQLRLS